MIDTRLIFVEGTSGSGKSTTSQLIQLRLRQLGHHIQWVAEDQSSHPLKGENNADFLHHPRQLRERLFSRWDDMAQTLVSDNCVYVMDGVLLNMVAGWLTLAGECQDDVTKTIRELLATSEPAHPAMVYLRPNDVPATVKRAIVSRGEEWLAGRIAHIADSPYGARHKITDESGFAEFFLHLAEIGDRVFQVFTTPKLFIEDPALNWESTCTRIGDFLEAGSLRLPRESTKTLAPYLGRYREHDHNCDWVIAADNDNLVLDDAPPRRLLRQCDDTFYVEGVAAKLEFQRDDRGAIHRLICVDHSAAEYSTTTWVRVAAETEIAGKSEPTS